MRKEDKLRLPPQLRVKLPPGFSLKPTPGGYALYLHHDIGSVDLVATYDPATLPQWIEAAALRVVGQLKSPEGWRGLHTVGSPEE